MKKARVDDIIKVIKADDGLENGVVEKLKMVEKDLGKPSKKKTGLFGNFSQHGGGGSSQFPKLLLLTIALNTPVKHLKIAPKFST